MRSKALILGCVVFLLIVLFNLLTPKAYKYECDGSKNIEVRYQDKIVNIVLNDKRKFTLKQTLSASGIRFANKDESVIFWSKGTSAFLEENNNVTYEQCKRRQ
jgi:membrane-bound inhibitor of C-type lysozyme